MIITLKGKLRKSNSQIHQGRITLDNYIKLLILIHVCMHVYYYTISTFVQVMTTHKLVWTDTKPLINILSVLLIIRYSLTVHEDKLKQKGERSLPRCSRMKQAPLSWSSNKGFLGDESEMGPLEKLLVAACERQEDNKKQPNTCLSWLNTKGVPHDKHTQPHQINHFLILFCPLLFTYLSQAPNE